MIKYNNSNKNNNKNTNNNKKTKTTTTTGDLNPTTMAKELTTKAAK